MRLWALATHTYIAHPDETFQYLEPAHRLAFGSGVIFWEFLDGIRSWLLPGAIAGVMRAVAAVDPYPDAYISVLRLLCVGASLSVPYAGFRIAGRFGGPGAAIAAGLLCALSPQAVYFAPVVMSEPLATDAALLAIALGDGVRRPWLAGAFFGLASALRYQYAPVLGVVVLWQYARDSRSFWRVVAGGVAVVALAVGVLDALTWGTPFQSVWLNYQRNGPQGVSQAIGEQTWAYYLEYFLAAWGAATPVLLALLVYGATRAPVLALLVACTIGLHMLPPHKELRFILLATVAIPMLLGIGLEGLLTRLPSRWSGQPVRVALTSVLGLLIAWGTTARATGAADWHRDRSMLRATAAARAIDGVCGLAIRTSPVYRTGGYTYWHRDVPLYFGAWDGARRIPGSGIALQLDSVLNGRSVAQYPDAALAAHAEKFNAIVGSPTDGLPGFTEYGCYGAGRPDDPSVCVFARLGGCG